MALLSDGAVLERERKKEKKRMKEGGEKKETGLKVYREQPESQRPDLDGTKDTFHVYLFSNKGGINYPIRKPPHPLHRCDHSVPNALVQVWCLGTTVTQM